MQGVKILAFGWLKSRQATEEWAKQGFCFPAGSKKTTERTRGFRAREAANASLLL